MAGRTQLLVSCDAVCRFDGRGARKLIRPEFRSCKPAGIRTNGRLCSAHRRALRSCFQFRGFGRAFGRFRTRVVCPSLPAYGGRAACSVVRGLVSALYGYLGETAEGLPEGSRASDGQRSFTVAISRVFEIPGRKTRQRGRFILLSRAETRAAMAGYRRRVQKT